jgi:hypothetical protein
MAVIVESFLGGISNSVKAISMRGWNLRVPVSFRLTLAVDTTVDPYPHVFEQSIQTQYARTLRFAPKMH